MTRTLSITAQGLTAAQLPDLRPPVPTEVKVYPDQPQSETRPDGDTLVAQKILKSALVPSQPGELTLPEVRLPWWDTKTGKARVASLPARTLQVLPAAAGASSPPPATANPSAQPEAFSQPVAEPSQPPAEPTAQSAPLATAPARAAGGSEMSRLGDELILASGVPTGYWPWLVTVLALAWLVSTILWLRARAAGPSVSAAPAQQGRPAPDPTKALGLVKKACNVGDARAARQALLDWAAARWPQDPPQRLETLARRLSGDAAHVLRALDRGLYARVEHSWDGSAAWHRLAPTLGKEARTVAVRAEDSPLPPLYPQQA